MLKLGSEQFKDTKKHQRKPVTTRNFLTVSTIFIFFYFFLLASFKTTRFSMYLHQFGLHASVASLYDKLMWILVQGKYRKKLRQFFSCCCCCCCCLFIMFTLRNGKSVWVKTERTVSQSRLCERKKESVFSQSHSDRHTHI